MTLNTVMSMAKYDELSYADVRTYVDMMVKELSVRFETKIDCRDVCVEAMSNVIYRQYDSDRKVVFVKNRDGDTLRRLTDQEAISVPSIIADLTAKVLDRAAGKHIPKNRVQLFVNSYIREKLKSKSIAFVALNLVSNDDFVDQCIPIIYDVMQAYIV